jgi:hypothetical protein
MAVGCSFAAGNARRVLYDVKWTSAMRMGVHPNQYRKNSAKARARKWGTGGAAGLGRDPDDTTPGTEQLCWVMSAIVLHA